MFFFILLINLYQQEGGGGGGISMRQEATPSKKLFCVGLIKMGIRMHLQAQEIRERVLTALIPDSCCDRCMTILMTRGMRSDFFFSRCKIPIYFKSKSVKKKERETGNIFLIKKEIIDLHAFFSDCIAWCSCLISLRSSSTPEVPRSFTRANEIVM